MMRFFTFIALLLLLVPSNAAISSQMVETLPGFPGKLPFKLETGYVGVGDSDSVQLFYYFVESERDPDEDPLILWLTGGPGCSGFYAFVYEVGPLLFDYAKSSSGRVKVPVLKLNPYSWTKVSNIIFIDAPVGTGFSYATNSEAYVVDDILSATQTSEFLRKWLLSHPRFLKNPLYISGDSYSGIIVPILVKMISDDNDAGIKPRMNLKGYSIGNPITNEVVDENWRVPFAQRLGLLPDKLYESTKRDCRGKYVDVDPSNAACLGDLEVYTQCTNMLNTANVLEPNCARDSPKPMGRDQSALSKWDPNIIEEDSLELLSTLYNSEPWCRPYNYVFCYIWANDENVQNALHVRKGTKKWWPRCNNSLAYTESVPSTVPYHKNLTNKAFAVLIYSGDHDMVAPYVGTLAWVRSLNLTESSKWRPWYVQGQVGGYTVEYTHNNNYSLTYATVKGAGHTAPEYKPEDCYAMFTRWIARLPL
ncbi:serine carboxypeptidase-like 18 isoform X1 [Prosopis cineraria]|uniref:serine carboxypeptidase-like 18 isoform X1 n=1 Tax=Prosopis cineraria TaxID=364024 RepID=UPI0024103ECE|nr:serine carboxypeptidase-like 18 isoform X1 [Prosopis cineraria]